MFTKDDLRKYIQDRPAAEFEAEHIVYYAHIAEDGSLADDCSKALETFTCRLHYSDYGFSKEEYDNQENPEGIYAREVDGDPLFEEILDNLYKQASEFWFNR